MLRKRRALGMAVGAATLLVPLGVAGPANAQAEPADKPKAAPRFPGKCDGGASDFTTELAGYGVKNYSTHIALNQLRITDKTYATVKRTKSRAPSVWLEKERGKPNSKPDAICGPVNITKMKPGRGLGYMNNRGNSVRVCIRYPGKKTDCGKWKVENQDGEIRNLSGSAQKG